MSDTAYKIEVMQAYENGERIRIREISSGLVNYTQKGADCIPPAWNWPYVEYFIDPTAIKFVGYVNIVDRNRYNGSTVHSTRQSAEFESEIGDDRVGVPVLVTEII